MTKQIIKSSPFLLILIGLIGINKLVRDFQVAYAHTGIKNIFGFYIFLIFIVSGILFLVVNFTPIKRETRNKVFLLSGSVLFAFLLVEITLRQLHINTTYVESRQGVYVSPYIRQDDDTLHIILPTMPRYLETAEFKYPRKANNKGFRDVDFYAKTDTTKLLIQTYGDSFTEGDGSPMDSSYPSVLRKMLAHDFAGKFIIQNFGVCGSDPAFSYKQFEHIGVQLHPDVIVLTYCSFDFTSDFFMRGGLERFNVEYLDCYKAPRWEMLYAYSYVFRLFIRAFTEADYNYSFIDKSTREKRMESLKVKWNETFLKIADLAQQNNIAVVLIKKPEGSEIYNNEYMFNFDFFKTLVDTLPVFKHYDLLPYYRDSANFNKDNISNYYWKYDGHHNPKGYGVMAKGVYDGLKKSYPEIFTTVDSIKRGRNLYSQ